MAAGRHAAPRRVITHASTRQHGRHRRPSRRLGGMPIGIVALTTAPLVVVGGTAAYAYWSASGSGSAAVPTSTATAITVTATPSKTLFPGASSDVVVTMGNSNPYPVTMTKLTVLTVTSSDSAACPSSWITLPSAVSTGVGGTGYVLPSAVSIANESSSNTTLTNLVTMAPEAPNECQGKTFTVAMTFTGDQVV